MEAFTEVAPGLAVIAFGLQQAKEHRVWDEVSGVLAILAAIGLPSIGFLLFRATVNKLDERYPQREVMAQYRADIDTQMARLATDASVWVADLRKIEANVAQLMADERHTRKKLENVESQMKAMNETLTEIRIGFADLRHDIKTDVLDRLEAIRAQRRDD